VNPAKTSRPRERQSVWCCGASYQRWRFKGEQFQDAPRYCDLCGQQILWPVYTGPLGGRKSALAFYYRRRKEFISNGLTSHGKARVREVPILALAIEDIDVAVLCAAACYESLPTTAQAAMLRLNKTLAALRRKIIKQTGREEAR
jgi:hypothetical protein